MGFREAVAEPSPLLLDVSTVPVVDEPAPPAESPHPIMAKMSASAEALSKRRFLIFYIPGSAK
jgi:hypothetical protein